MMKSKHIGLFCQFAGLIMATSVAAGGGQYPGNIPSLLAIYKFVLFTLPLVICCFRLNRQQDLRIVFNQMIKQNMVLILALAAIILSIPLAVYPQFSLQRYLYTLFGFAGAFALAVQYLSIPHAFHIYSQHALWCGSLILLWLLTIILLFPDDTTRNAVQITGLIHPNMLSSLCAQFLLLAMFQPASNKVRVSVTAGLFCAVVVLQSRGIWISLTCALFISLTANTIIFRSKYALVALTALMLTTLVFVMIGLFSPAFVNNILQIFSRGQMLEDMATFSNRLILWQTLLESFTWQQMLVGHGYAIMSPAVGADFGSGILYGAHNAYLSLYLGTGLLTCLLFMGYWLRNLLSLIRKRKNLNRQLFNVGLTSFFVLFTHALVAEEFGLHLAPTLLLVFLNFQFVLWSHENLLGHI